MDSNKTSVKTKIFSTLYVFFFCGLLAATPVARANIANIILSEIQITGSTGHSNDDFVELYNPNPTPIDISSYRLRYRNSSGTESSLNKIKDGTCIAAHGYYLWANSGGAFADMANTKTSAGLSTKYSLALMPPEGTGYPLIDSISWENSYPFDTSAFKFSNSPKANESMVRDIVTNDWLPSFSLSPTPTKSADTTCPSIPPTSDPAPAIKTVRLNEIFPNPSAKGDAGEFIELYNFGTESVDISGWILHDATKTGKHVFPAGTVVAGGEYFAVTDQSFKLSLNNSNETVSLFDNKEALIDSIIYTTSKDDISLNYTPSGWRGGTPTPNAANKLNNLPTTKENVPKKGYKGMLIAMTTKGKDKDKDKLKYVWDFGDGHKSYKQETSHTYEKTGTYTVTLKTTDNKDDIIETFTLEIVKYEIPDIRIASFIPNPSGNDTDNEWILIENREKKKTIDLLGFGIATGWKSLANHPVRQSFIIPPKSSAKLTREYSLFTLPNQKGKIELRAPDGEVIQDIKYTLEKSAPDDAVYEKKKGERWKLGPAPKKESATTKIAAVAGAMIDETTLEEISPPPIEPEEPPLPKEGHPLPAVVRNDLMTKDPNRPRLSDLINYGLSLHLPKAIAYVPHYNIPVLSAAAEYEMEKISTDTLFMRINASINAWLNAV
jgi:PKD repeat protein